MTGTEAAVKPPELDAKLKRSSKSSQKIDEVELAALREEFPFPPMPLCRRPRPDLLPPA